MDFNNNRKKQWNRQSSYLFKSTKEEHFGISNSRYTRRTICRNRAYITVFDRTFQPKEGDVLWIDVVPEISIDGALILDDDNSPTVLPDYRLKRILDTQKGQVARYGIAKIGGNNE